jgi:hypothetical protein
METTARAIITPIDGRYIKIESESSAADRKRPVAQARPGRGFAALLLGGIAALGRLPKRLVAKSLEKKSSERATEAVSRQRELWPGDEPRWPPRPELRRNSGGFAERGVRECSAFDIAPAALPAS